MHSIFLWWACSAVCYWLFYARLVQSLELCKATRSCIALSINENQELLRTTIAMHTHRFMNSRCLAVHKKLCLQERTHRHHQSLSLGPTQTPWTDDHCHLTLGTVFAVQPSWRLSLEQSAMAAAWHSINATMNEWMNHCVTLLGHYWLCVTDIILLETENFFVFYIISITTCFFLVVLEVFS